MIELDMTDVSTVKKKKTKPKTTGTQNPKNNKKQRREVLEMSIKHHKESQIQVNKSFSSDLEKINKNNALKDRPHVYICCFGRHENARCIFNNLIRPCND